MHIFILSTISVLQLLQISQIYFSPEFQTSTPDNTIGSGTASPERGITPLPLPQPELDNETLRSGLRDFIQELRDAQKERVTALHTQQKYCMYHDMWCEVFLVYFVE